MASAKSRILKYCNLPNEKHLLKESYAGMLKATDKWTHPVQNWNLTLSQLSIHFEGRVEQYVELLADTEVRPPSFFNIIQ